MKRSRSLPTILLLSLLMSMGIAPSPGTETPTTEEEVLANGDDYVSDFDLSDVPSGFTYEALINGELYTPPAGNTRGEYEPEPLSAGGTTSTASYSVQSTTTTTWAACGAFDAETKTVRTFTRNFVSYLNLQAGNSPLKCGNDKFGYRHIKSRHMNDWGSLAGIVGSNWRDFADWSINQCLRWPASVANNGTRNTYEFKAPIQIRDKRTKKVVSTKYCNVPISRGSSRQLITAFPSSR